MQSAPPPLGGGFCTGYQPRSGRAPPGAGPVPHAPGGSYTSRGFGLVPRVITALHQCTAHRPRTGYSWPDTNERPFSVDRYRSAWVLPTVPSWRSISLCVIAASRS